MITGRYA